MRQPLTADQIQQARYIPKNALPITEPGLGVVYVYRSRAGKFAAIAYREKAYRSDWHYSYRTDAELDMAIAGFFDGIRQHKTMVANRRKQDYAGHSFTVGDIVTNSWGYDQTNVDWYVVTRTSKNYVWLQPCHSTMDESEGCGPMSGNVALALDENLQPILGKGKESKHRASGQNVTMRHGCGTKYTGGSLYTSWYA